VNLAFRRGCARLTLIPAIFWLIAFPPDCYDGEVHLLRQYTKDNAALVEVSTDGHFFLVRGTRRVPGCPVKRTCLASVLAVYEANARKSISELVSQEDGNLFDAGFVRGDAVNVIEQEWNSAPIHFEWNPDSGSRSVIPWTVPGALVRTCVIDDRRLLVVDSDQLSKPFNTKFAVADASGLRALQQPTVPYELDFAGGLFCAQPVADLGAPQQTLRSGRVCDRLGTKPSAAYKTELDALS